MINDVSCFVYVCLCDAFISCTLFFLCVGRFCACACMCCSSPLGCWDANMMECHNHSVTLAMDPARLLVGVLSSDLLGRELQTAFTGNDDVFCVALHGFVFFVFALHAPKSNAK